MPEKSPPGWGFIRKWLEKLAVKHAVDIDIGEFRDHMDSSVSASENWDKAKKYLYERYGIVCGADEERMRRAIIESAEDEEKKYVRDFIAQYKDIYPDLFEKYGSGEFTEEEVDRDIELEREILRGKVKSLEAQLEAERKKAVPPEEVALRVVKETVKKEMERAKELEEKRMKELSDALAHALKELSEGVDRRLKGIEKKIKKEGPSETVVITPQTALVNTEDVVKVDDECIAREMRAIFKERYGRDLDEWRNEIRFLKGKDKEKADNVELSIYDLAVENCRAAKKEYPKMNPQLRGALSQLMYFDEKKNTWAYVFPQTEAYWNPILRAEHFPKCMTPDFILYKAIREGKIDRSDCLDAGIPDWKINAMLREGRKVAEKYGFGELL